MRGRRHLDLVENRQLREAAEQAVQRGMSWTEIARRADIWWNGQPDGARLKRALGIVTWRKVKGDRVFLGRQARVNHALAVRIMVAIDADPFEVGL